MVPSEAQIQTNLRRGALEYCILALLRGRERYGLDIARDLTQGTLLASEGTLYPLLSRLRKGGLVATSWQESESGPPRRYYSLTADGHRALQIFEATWKPFRSAVDAALASGTE
ncbi:PadR family transcriptional regulator [Phytoactinopolyspora halotolerans]|uniref:PadR family transcriptional regulator n=1 Tax=Phytoactinopolyspora halotolerans TaxID=1981512 RepID=A0A6L9SFY5_9ACTN|nr:PadR family transcriptional regulator [Phytoactinopolyspora halotolerans]NEE03564.1 PadR family transcriptional regulator [Phytoactinopolyspora halotolerans]